MTDPILYGPDGETIRSAPTEVDTDSAWFQTVLELLRTAAGQATDTLEASEACGRRSHNAGQANAIQSFEYGEPPLMLVLAMSEVTALSMPQMSNGFRACGRRVVIDLVDRIDRLRIIPTRIGFDQESRFAEIEWVGTDPVDARRPALALTLTATEGALQGAQDARLYAERAAVREAVEVIDGSE